MSRSRRAESAMMVERCDLEGENAVRSEGEIIGDRSCGEAGM